MQVLHVKKVTAKMKIQTQAVNNFIEKHNLRTSPETRYIDLVSEIGELGKEILTATNYGKSEFAGTANTKMELGDCLFSLLALCTEMNIDPEGALQKALMKYEARFREKGHVGSN